MTAPLRWKRYELDYIKPNITTLLGICKEYKTTPNFLLGFTEDSVEEKKGLDERLALVTAHLSEEQIKVLIYTAQRFFKVTVDVEKYIGLTGRLRLERERRGMPREMLAELIGYPQALLTAIENGYVGSIPLDALCRMCDVFDITLDEFLCSKNPQNP